MEVRKVCVSLGGPWDVEELVALGRLMEKRPEL